MINADDLEIKEDGHLGKRASKSMITSGGGVPNPPSDVTNGEQSNKTGRTKCKVDKGRGDHTRNGSAPAKRVVSDGHWRATKSPSKMNTTYTAKGTHRENDNRVKPMADPKSGGRERDSKRTQANESAGGDDGIRVYVTPPGSRKTSTHHRRRSHRSDSNENASDINLSDPGADDSSAQRRKSSVAEKSQLQSLSATTTESRRRRSSNQLAYNAAESPQTTKGPLSDGRGSSRSHKSNLLSQVFEDSRRIFTKQAQEPIITPRAPSIEAWLNETPDPFIDADKPPTEVAVRLQPSCKTTKAAAVETVLEDSNRIWDALDTKEGTRRAVNGSKRRKRVASSAVYQDNPFPADFNPDSASAGSGIDTIPTSASKFVDLVQENYRISPASLKRQLARKSVSSPIDDRHIKEDLGKEHSNTTSLSTDTVSPIGGLAPSDSLKPPRLESKRPIPSTGKHRLSTIASVETFNTKQGDAPPSVSDMSERVVQPAPIGEDQLADEAGDRFDPSSLERVHSCLTKHADLISILSLPQAQCKSIRSARSIRTNRSRLATATIGDLMQELSTDESKYMRELRTLVDGVIPVLLSCVLSKSDSAVAAGLFRPSSNAHTDPNFTRPIVEMGISLERLKTLHKRIPQNDFVALLTWAHGAQRVYSEYLKAWRMGFQDVIVNLAPATENGTSLHSSPIAKCQVLDEGLPRNQDGDVVNGDGERVDVAFLLKRPLVRLKYLAKTLKGIQIIKPSAEAEKLAAKYQQLVDDARQRSNEERARLEDEAASNIDPTRARDPRTLAPLIGVVVDRTRRVRARDHFNLRLQHSSGQRVDCRVELLLRDEASDSEQGGDLLICELDGTGRWLLFPPIQYSHLSARTGDIKGEIVVMITGVSGSRTDWQELFSLRSEDEQTGFEWVQMLGLTPIPPKVLRSHSFLTKQKRDKFAPPSTLSSLEPPLKLEIPARSRTPSPREVEIPIGEQANDASKTWIERSASGLPGSPVTPSSRDPARLRRQSEDDLPSTPPRSSNNYVDQVNDRRSLPSQSRDRGSTRIETIRTPRSFKEALGLSGTSTSVGLRRTRAKRLSRPGEVLSSTPRSANGSLQDAEPHTSSPKASRAHKPATNALEIPNDLQLQSPELKEECTASNQRSSVDSQNEKERPTSHRSHISLPSTEIPYIPKRRINSPPTTPITYVEEDQEWPLVVESQQDTSSNRIIENRSASSNVDIEQGLFPFSRPTQQSSSPHLLNKTKSPVLGKSQTQVNPRRSSSPLKHEYEPSTASESPSDSETSTVERNEATSISDSSEGDDVEGGVPTLLMPLGALDRISKISPRASVHATPNGSVKPSESASQAPYKSVPAQPTKASKTIASIFSWSDLGSWESLHPDECSIVITPGLIEAYEMSAAHSVDKPLSYATPVVDSDAFSELASNLIDHNIEVQGDRPLIALELTPLVPLRRGTALDISIRSPPTPNSQITSGNNIMFRSRNPEECEALYALINHSRINNPTFIALQNARASGGAFSSSINRRTSKVSSRSSWFGGWGRSSSYRASSAPTPSIAPSESSIGSMSSAFSALRRFGKGTGGGMFNISRSTITSREGSRANSVYTGSDNSSGSGTSSPLPPGLTDAGKDATIGLSNAKIRLYIRETASRWRDMGSARLTIMRPEKSNPGPDGRPMNSAHQGINEKRIVVNGKTKGEVLLDVQLGESCFERVARTGIALSVWEDVIGPNGEVGVVGAVGGVGGGRARVYMIQVNDVFL